MAVETTVTSANFTGTGASASYSPGFYVNSSNQVKVYVNNVLKTIGDDYTVNNVGVSTGCTVVANFPLGSAVYIERQTPITQLVDTKNNETILEDVLDAEFDKLTMIAQEIAGKVLRALLVPQGETGFTLPAAAARANKFLGFDGAGAAIMSLGTTGDDLLRTELAQSTALGGPGLLGFSHSSAYANGTVGSHLKAFVVASDPPFNVRGDDATDNATGINAALAYCDSLGGGDVLLPGGKIRHSATIDNKYPRVRLVGRGFDYVHDSGTVSATRTVLKPTFAGTALKIRTPYAAEQGVAAALTQKYWGAGAIGFTIDCGGVATKAAEIDSVSGVEVQLFATGCVGTTCFEVKCGVTGTNLGEACDVQHSRIWVAARLIDSTAEKACHICTLSGSSNANVSLNRGPLSGIFVGGQHWDGHALLGGCADNNDITVSAYRAGGSGRPLYAKGPTAAIPVGFDSNCIRYLASAGTAYAEGTDTGGVTNGVTNMIEHLDRANGSPLPTAGTGSYWEVHGTDGVMHGLTFNKVVLADSEANAKAERANLGTGSVRIRNGSDAHVTLTDGTNVWSVAVLGAGGDLRFAPLAGSGKIVLGNGAKVLVNGQMGFNGTAPIAKPTVTGSKGANAALASLLTALANYGLITDSST